MTPYRGAGHAADVHGTPNTPAYPADTGASAAPVGRSASPSVLSTATYPGWEAVE